MEKQYIINESELISLLADAYTLQCLESEGVKDWKRYLINKDEFLKNLGNFRSFYEVAESELKYYEKYK